MINIARSKLGRRQVYSCSMS